MPVPLQTLLERLVPHLMNATESEKRLQASADKRDAELRTFIAGGLLKTLEGFIQAQGSIVERLDQIDARQIKTLGLLTEIRRILAPGEAVFAVIEFTDEATGATTTIKNGEKMILPLRKRVSFAVTFKDADGNPTVLDGPANLNMTNPSAVLSDVGPDGLSGKITSGSKTGVGLLSIEGDARIGEGVVPVAVTADINIPAGEAVTAEVTFGELEDAPIEG